jgi:hypothetical protein
VTRERGCVPSEPDVQLGDDAVVEAQGEGADIDVEHEQERGAVYVEIAAQEEHDEQLRQEREADGVAKERRR